MTNGAHQRLRSGIQLFLTNTTSTNSVEKGLIFTINLDVRQSRAPDASTLATCACAKKTTQGLLAHLRAVERGILAKALAHHYCHMPVHRSSVVRLRD